MDQLFEKVSIRPMIGMDREVIDRLECESFYEKCEPWNGPPIGWSGVDQLVSERNGFGVVAELPPDTDITRRNVLGYAVYTVIDDAMIMQRICVDPVRQGIGTMLLTALYDRMRTKERSSIITAVRANDVITRAFLMRRGFECAGRYLARDGVEFFDYAITSDHV